MTSPTAGASSNSRFKGVEIKDKYLKFHNSYTKQKLVSWCDSYYSWIILKIKQRNLSKVASFKKPKKCKTHSNSRLVSIVISNMMQLRLPEKQIFCQLIKKFPSF